MAEGLPTPDPERGVRVAGELLLQGWCLLGTPCPVPACHQALLRNPKDAADMYCPACDLRVRMAEEGAHEENGTAADPAAGQGGGGGSKDADGQFADAKEEQEAAAQEQAQRQEQVQEQQKEEEQEGGMSMETLQRWEEERLMRQQQEREEGGGAADVSERLGEYMLHGWTLMDVGCPRKSCRGTPLMLNKPQGDLLCVKCDETFRMEGDRIVSKKDKAKEQEQEQEQEKDDAKETAREQLRLEKAEAATRQSAPTSSSRGASNSRPPPSVRPADRPRTQNEAPTITTTRPTSQPELATANAIRAVEDKIEATAAALSAASSVQDCMQMAELIEQLARTARALHDIQRVRG